MIVAAALAAVVLSGDGFGRSAVPTTEVVVTLKTPPLAAFGRSLLSARHASYARRLASAQAALQTTIEHRIPYASVRWHYHLVADGMAVVVPKDEVAALRALPGVAAVWPNVTYHALAVKTGVQQIGADKLWGADLSTAGEGIKIGIIDDGLDAAHPYFNPTGFQYPPGFPKGQTKYATPKVIVQRTFTPAASTYKNAALPFDPTQSFHATHVAGIAAGDYATGVNGTTQISGVAPRAYLGNYKALTQPTPGFGLDGNSAEIAAAIEAAVADGMNVVNLSLGEPEVEPSRDLVVAAIEAAARAGVVPVVAAGNDFDQFGYGSVSSPGNAPDAITVAAVTSGGEIADFSSAGPAPVSLGMKPDVAAPGVDVLSSLPPSQGLFGLLSGTSMAAPHVAGAAALLKQRHPTWTVAQLKSALVQTGDPVHGTTAAEVSPLREGGGLVDLPKADGPLLFADPTNLAFPQLERGEAATRTVTLTDAGGGAGDWTVTAPGLTAPPTVTVPGTLTLTANGANTPGQVSSFVTLTRGADTRRIPFWFETVAPKLAQEPFRPLARPGLYIGTTRGGRSLVSTYSFPTGDAAYTGPERVYRFRLTRNVANFGVAVIAGRAVPHVTIGPNETHLAGYPALPIDLNPYRKQYGAQRPIAGAILPAPGTYAIAFDSHSAAQAGPFVFRFWVNDTTPPRLRVRSLHGGIAVAASDAGSGVDPASISATLDGRTVKTTWSRGLVRIRASKGAHRLVLTVSDYQETKNMEDVPPILPNTTTLRAVVRVS